MSKLIPATKLNGEYQFNIIQDIITVITKISWKNDSILDDNKVNQKFVKCVQLILQILQKYY